MAAVAVFADDLDSVPYARTFCAAAF
jgi:hypothetical protein